MEELVEFIQSNPDSREIKRALAVQVVLKGYLYPQIAEILSVWDSFIAPMVARVWGRGGDGVATLGSMGARAIWMQGNGKR